MKLQTYKEYAPTSFDARGLSPDRHSWIVAPCGKSRDSKALECSNFAVALHKLGGESETLEVHRFGHWACGWFEIILVSPERRKEVEAIALCLDDYPVLDEMLWYEFQREMGEAVGEDDES